MIGRVGPQQTLKVLDRLFVIGSLAAYIAYDSRHTVHNQQGIAMPLDIGHVSSLQAAGVTIRTHIHNHGRS
jgi:hypothetical protein